MDPPLIGCSIPSRLQVHFMAKQELFGNKLFGAVLRRIGAYPVDRDGAGYAAVRTSFRLLSRSKVICLFPEGTRSKNGVVQRAHPGAAMIAAHCLAPVLPVAITGPYRFGKPLQVSFGPVFHLPSPEGGDRKHYLKASSELIMSRIKELIIQDQEMENRGKHDGCPRRCGE